jgi:hypothetical protein
MKVSEALTSEGLQDRMAPGTMMGRLVVAVHSADNLYCIAAGKRKMMT